MLDLEPSLLIDENQSELTRKNNSVQQISVQRTQEVPKQPLGDTNTFLSSEKHLIALSNRGDISQAMKTRGVQEV